MISGSAPAMWSIAGAKNVMAVGLIFVAAAMPLNALGSPALRSIEINLPAGDGLFLGSGADTINNNCLACHSPDMVLNQPTLSRGIWENEVRKMIKAYKAPVSEADIDQIVDYLVHIRNGD